MSEPKCNCDGCHMDLCKGLYLCSSNDYQITEENGEKIRTVTTHELQEGDNEVGSSEFIQYCPCCGHNYMIYPHSYDNNDNKFKQKDNNEITYYDYFLYYNIIHNFENIQCEHCSNILEKGTFTLEIIEETEENMDNLSMPNDFIKDIHIYNLEGALIKTIEPNDYQEYKELHDYTSNDSKNLLYCNDCNFCILNSLKKIYR